MSTHKKFHGEIEFLSSSLIWSYVCSQHIYIDCDTSLPIVDSHAEVS